MATEAVAAPGIGVRLRRWVRGHIHLLVLAAVLAAFPLFPRKVPGGIWGLGIVAGAGYALQAMGLVLVYRTNRVINFAQVQLGMASATLFTALAAPVSVAETGSVIGATVGVNNNIPPLLLKVREVCPPCMTEVSPWMLTANYYFALVVSLVLAPLLGFALYHIVMRRFHRSPRLLATVATVFAMSLFAGVQTQVPGLLAPEGGTLNTGRVGSPPGLDFTWNWGFLPFRSPDIITVALALLGGIAIAVYRRFASSGTASRAMGADSERAASLGVKVHKLSGRVWALAAFLSGAAAILHAMGSGVESSGQSFDAQGLVKTLAAAVLGGMASLPLAAVGSIAFGALESASSWAFPSSTLIQLLFPITIFVILLTQSPPRWRSRPEQGAGWPSSKELRPIPPELKSLAPVKAWTRGGFVLGALLLLAAPFLLPQEDTDSMASAFIIGILVYSLFILTGWAGQISLGQVGIAAVGAFVASALQLPFFVSLIVGAAAGVAVSLALGIPALRLRGLNLGIITLAGAVAIPLVLPAKTELGRPSFFGFSFQDYRLFYYLCLLMLTLVVVAVVGMRRSRAVRALIASRENEPAAQLFGINLVRARMLAFGAAGVLAAVGGVMMAYQNGGFTPGIEQADPFAPDKSLDIFTTAALGGLGATAGPLVGVLYPFVMLLVSAAPGVGSIAQGASGIVLLMLAPGGYSQVIYAVRDTWLRRLAQRRGIWVPSLMGPRDEITKRMPIAPKERPGAGAVFAPGQYALDDQWAVEDEELAEPVRG